MKTGLFAEYEPKSDGTVIVRLRTKWSVIAWSHQFSREGADKWVNDCWPAAQTTAEHNERRIQEALKA